MQVRFKTTVPIAHKGRNGKTTIRDVPFYYDQQEWQPTKLPPIGYNIGFKRTKMIFKLAQAITSSDGATTLMVIVPVDPIYPENIIDELILAGWCVLEKEFIGEH